MTRVRVPSSDPITFYCIAGNTQVYGCFLSQRRNSRSDTNPSDGVLNCCLGAAATMSSVFTDSRDSRATGDLLANLDGERTVIDFKTSGSSYEEHEVALSDQLTAYQLAEPSVVQCAFCVFVKTKEPRIEWYTSTRTSGHFREFLSKAQLIGQDIAANRFYKRQGKQQCTTCDYLPICTGDLALAQSSLRQVA